MAKRHILAFICFARAVVITVFLLVPPPPMSVYVFSAVMGTLWLSTKIAAHQCRRWRRSGVQHLSMLSSFVFFSHQIGSFFGVAGRLSVHTSGSYDIVWYLAIALGVAAGLINLPVREARIAGPHHRRPEHAGHPQNGLPPWLRCWCCWRCLRCTCGRLHADPGRPDLGLFLMHGLAVPIRLDQR